MPKFLFQGSYTPTGAQGLAKEGGSGRVAAVEKTLKRLEGRLEAMYYAFGETDVFIIADLPDTVAANALALAVNQTGLAHVRTTVLVTAQEVDQATKRATDYRPPGR